METDGGFRLERDALGTLEVPASAYYGIHTARAMENFAVGCRRVNPHLIKALIMVKKAAALAHLKLNSYPPEIAMAIVQACDDIHVGEYADHFPVSALQGGAGTSTNMNINEVLANRAIELLGGIRGDYTVVHPLDHVNCCQSTNDVYPTALRIAAVGLVRRLSDAFASLQESLQRKELEFADVLKLGRTELMDAVPMTAGQGFGAYAKAIQRDRWRLYKAEERLREINIGGTAIGTGINAPLRYTFYITGLLQELTGYGLARSEYPMDPTQNMDVFVEVSGLLKAAAVNLLKISGDLRLLASGPSGGFGELELPAVQAGSSIMPGKVNPVMAEMLSTAAMRVIANDAAVTLAASSGQLELNAFMPQIADALLDSLELLDQAVCLFTVRCVNGIRISATRCRELLEHSTGLAAAFVGPIGYERSAEVAIQARAEGKSIRQVLLDRGLLSVEQIDGILRPEQLTTPGVPGRRSE
ncbi:MULTISPECIES: aspartate ammonia-lyase [unclassified Paenibacillus]|uniref:aspartate ammonia-lyase n=1 Tax=unclassified Paenibacillus TaxID=185978 RepID=UPI002406239A|nr:MULTISPECIES: aspartate ammonia-lyase [unclassified Paenibacillus]MDF9839276.1 aspartate ammonia-lyase [Paenibacillus sp. PastF-2]MDF9845857.1 aspartate ammonia-lyase [Paenibacillus sp. PastM-2]MDF9852430.1 aspartate ammonia-lyase [Paenibacillus sp. PastF-1]MDH6477840.1 aspartate ammonia-lyase [Paenibacillus sp. PastH-2]MDH6505579.1 aspartate ammonia-lyase [Paenibacillus sp. PastM-3]